MQKYRLRQTQEKTASFRSFLGTFGLRFARGRGLQATIAAVLESSISILPGCVVIWRAGSMTQRSLFIESVVVEEAKFLLLE